jgi:hypothetical protein
MKKIIIASIFALNCLTIFAQKPFFYNLSATLPVNEKTTKLYIAYEAAGIKFKDSLDFGKKQLTLKKTLTQPVEATIYTNNKTVKPLSVMLANNTLSLVMADNSISIGVIFRFTVNYPQKTTRQD